MILYHIKLLHSYDNPSEYESITLSPRIPEKLLNGYYEEFAENRTIERICFAESIEGCLTAIRLCNDLENYNGNDSIETEDKMINDIIFGNKIETPFIKFYNLSVKFMLYEIDTDNFNDTNWISSVEIYRKGYVPDANITKENWIVNINDLQLHGKLYILTDVYAKETLYYPYKMLKNGIISRFNFDSYDCFTVFNNFFQIVSANYFQPKVTPATGLKNFV
jgi:hypothetical protein